MRTSAPLAVLRPGGLISNLVGVPATISVGQALSLRVQLTNSGQTAVDTAIASLSQRSGPGDGTLTISGPAETAQNLAPGSSATFTFQVTANSAGPSQLTASGSGTVQGGGAATVSPSTADLVLQAPAQLTGRLTTDRTRVSVGQTLQLTFVVQNTGQADATSVSPAAPATAAGTTASLDAITLVSAGTIAVLHGGQSVSFIWTTSARSAGQVAFLASAQGTDGNDPSMTPSTGSITSAAVEAQLAGVLAISAVAGPARISAGLQRPSLKLTATNSGGADVVLSDLPPPVAATTGSAAVAIVSQPVSASGLALRSGGSRDFTWTFDASGRGTVSRRASASGTESNTGATLAPAAATTAANAIEAPAALALSLAASPLRVSAGLQRVQVALTATNTGGASLRLDPLPAPTVRATGSAAATLAVSPPSAGGTVLAGGASQTFSWKYDVSGSGTLTFAATASGTDADSGTPVNPPAASAPAVEVQAPGALAATATASPGQVSAGLQQVSLVLTLQNAGGAAVRLDALPTPAVTAGGSAAAALSSSPPSPAGDLLAGGATKTFTWVWNVSGSGTLAFSCSASGADANAGVAIAGVTAASQPVTVQAPGALSVSASVSPARASAGASPAQVSAGLQQVALSVVLQNTGEADVILDTVPQPAVTSAGNASANVAGSPPSATGTVLPGGASKSMIWTWNMGGAGTVSFTASVTGHDSNSGSAIAPAPAPAGPVTVQTSGGLSLSIAATPTQVSAGLQQVSVTLSVTNTGGASVILDALAPPTVASGGSAAATLLTSPASPAGSTLSGGATRSFLWTSSVSGTRP